MRIFFSVNLPERVKNRLVSLYSFFDGKIKFVEKDNLHITLLFLGDVDPDKIAERVNVNHQKFRAKLSSVAIFSKRVIVVKVDDGGNLKALNEKLKEQLDVKDKPYKPHITIGRIKKLESREKPEVDDIEFEVGSFSLMKSELMPEGPVYTELKRYSLE